MASGTDGGTVAGFIASVASVPEKAKILGLKLCGQEPLKPTVWASVEVTLYKKF
jgi:hypothetical protein